MALKLGELQIDIGADTKDLDRADKKVKSTAKSMEKSFSRLGQVIAGALSFEAARRVLMIADNMVRLRGRVDNLAKSQKESNELFKELVGLANEVGIEITGVVSVFQRFGLVKDIVGATNDQVLQFTANIQKLGIVSGATGQEITATSIQIGQAIANNFEAAAQEINSINEQLPEVARAIERSLGLIPGSFKKAVTEGQVSAEQFFNAILEQTDEIQSKFEKLPITIARAANVLANNFAVALSDADSILGTTRQIARILEEAADITAADWGEALINIRMGFIQLFGTIDQLATKTKFVLARLTDSVLSALGVSVTFGGKTIEQLESAGQAEIDISKKVTTELVAELEKRRQARAIERDTATLFSLTPDSENKVRGVEGAEALENGALDKVLKLLADETQAIELALLDREKKILALTRITEEERLDLLKRSAQKRNEQMAILEASRAQAAIATAQGVGDALTSVLKSSGAEQTAIGKAIFLANRALQVAGILVNTQAAAAQAAVTASIAGPLGYFTTKAGILASGFASAGLTAGIAIGEAFEHGGIVGGTSFAGDKVLARVNSGEMILNAQQQSKLFGIANGQGDAGSSPNIIIQSMPGVTVDPISVSRDEIVLIAQTAAQKAGDEAVQKVNSSLSRGQGSTFRALATGINTERNLR